MPKIIAYTKGADPYSVRLIEFLRRKQLSFREKQITDDDPDLFAEFTKRTGAFEPPILMIDDEVIGDYERVTSLDLQGKFDELLK